MPSYSGVWTLPAQYQAKGLNNWPGAPGAPTSVSATSGNQSATVSFTAPVFTGIPAGITGYLATSSPGGFTATGSSSPLTVTGLTNGTPYTISVQATNTIGYGPAGTSNSVTPSLPQTGLFAGGLTSFALSNITQTTIATTGTFSFFGNLTIGRYSPFGVGSTTRGVIGGGNDISVYLSSIEYVTFASAGNGTNFGNMTSALAIGVSMANGTRGVFAGGYAGGSAVNTMNYITIATTGNATTFGQLAEPQRNFSACSNTTYGVMMGGFSPNLGTNDYCQYITIATTGNSSSYGNLSQAATTFGGNISSSTRGLFSAGSFTSVIQYVTISTSGTNSAFGDLPWGASNFVTGLSNSVVGLMGQNSQPVQSMTIATLGSTSNFATLADPRAYMVGISTSNGGI